MTTMQMRLEDVRPEYFEPGAKAFFLALATAMSIRMEMNAAYRRRGYPELTQLDGAVLFHAFTWAIVGGDGTRQSEMLDHFHRVPAATVRGALRRLVRIGLLTVTKRAVPKSKVIAIVYHPARAVADVMNEGFEPNMAIHARMADAFNAYRRKTVSK